MRAFALKIVTPDGLRYDGQAEEVIVRTTSGDMGIMAGHINAVAPLGMGMATFVIDGDKRYASCIGGMISVVDSAVSIIATSFEWADQIDARRARNAQDSAERVLADKKASAEEIALAEARLKRALIRQSVAGRK